VLDEDDVGPIAVRAEQFGQQGSYVGDMTRLSAARFCRAMFTDTFNR